MTDEKPKLNKTIFGMEKIAKFVKRNKKAPAWVGFQDTAVTQTMYEDLIALCGEDTVFDKVTIKDSKLHKLSFIPKTNFLECTASVIGEFDKVDMPNINKRIVSFKGCPSAVPHLEWMPDTINVLYLTDTHICTADGFEKVQIRWNPTIIRDVFHFGWAECSVMFHYATLVFVRSLTNHMPRSLIEDVNNPEFAWHENADWWRYVNGYKARWFSDRGYTVPEGSMNPHIEIRRFLNCTKYEVGLMKQFIDWANGRAGAAVLEDI